MPTPIYHITNINNLARIVKTGRLWCDSERIRQGIPCVGIAHDHLKQRRLRTSVRDRAGRVVAAGGMLSDYVPFYFATRSPMLYSIHRGNIPGYVGGQADVVYLVSTVELVENGDRAWCFTDGHAVEAMTEFHTSVERLDTIDWAIINDNRWSNTDHDLDRKRRKQAEFLVHGFVPWSWFHRVGVIDQEKSQQVREIIAEAEHQPEIRIQPRWYY